MGKSPYCYFSVRGTTFNDVKVPKHNMPPLFQPERERPDAGLADAIKALADSICCLSEQNKLQLEWFKSHFALATLHDLKQMEKRIMADIATVKASLTEAKASITQVNLDIAETQTAITALTAKVAELQAAIDAGGTGVPQDIADLADEVKALAAQADAALPNPVVVPPPVV